MSRLDQKEFDALMAAIDEGRHTPEPTSVSAAPVMAYDLTNQERVFHRRMPALDAIDDRIASRFGAALGARLRLEVRSSAVPATFLKFVEVDGLLAGPTAIGVLGLGPGRGLGLLTLELGVAKALVACALGDRRSRRISVSNIPPPPGPPVPGAVPDLTCVEKAVLKSLFGVFVDAMAESWRDVVPFAPEILRFETDLRRAAIAEPTDLGIVSEYQLLGAAKGQVRLVIPFAAVEPEKERLAAPPRQRGRSDRRMAEHLRDSVRAVPIEIRAELGRARLSLRDFLALKTGDVLPLGQAEAAPIVVQVEGVPRITAWPKEAHGSAAIEIASGLGPVGADAAMRSLSPLPVRLPGAAQRRQRGGADG